MEKNFKVLDIDKNQHTGDFYLGFKEKLQETHSFPTDYMFKYIVPANQSTIAKLYSIFDNPEAAISTRDSKNGKYTSITIKTPVSDADDVIIYYKQAAEIEGIMSL